MPFIPYEDPDTLSEPSESERDKYWQKPYVPKDKRPVSWHVLVFSIAFALTAGGLIVVTRVLPGLGWIPGSNALGILFMISLFGPLVGACVIELMFGRL